MLIAYPGQLVVIERIQKAAQSMRVVHQNELFFPIATQEPFNKNDGNHR